MNVCLGNSIGKVSGSGSILCKIKDSFLRHYLQTDYGIHSPFNIMNLGSKTVGT